MSVTVTWKIERRLIHLDFGGSVTIEEIERASQTVTQYIRDGQAPVHVIADMVGVERYPHEVGRLAGAIPHLAESNLGKTILVGNNDRLVQLMISVIRRAVQIDLRMFDTLETAIDFLYQTDPTLPSDKTI